jgi:hypothetical protein
MKKLFIAVLLVASTVALSACKDDGLDKDIVAEISYVSWAGDGFDYYDIGHQNFTASDLTNVKVASVYATAKAFNEIYPNVKINYYGKVAGPNDGDVMWDQELLNYKDRNDEYPSVFAVIDTVQLLQQGVLADLSIYEDTDAYKSLNPDLLEQGNFYGVQAVLPGYFIPHGIFVNTSLIEDEFLPEVTPDWDFDDFTDLVTNGEGFDDGFSGLAALPSSWAKQLFIYDDLYDYGNVDLDNDIVKTFFSDGMKTWEPYQFYAHEEDFQEAHGSWSPVAFSDGVVTVYPEEPWYITDFSIDGGSMQGPEGYDLYPFPDYNGSGTTISTVVDPLGVYNYCNSDGNPECTEEERTMQDLAFEFATFMVADTRAWEARAAMEYGKVVDGEVLTVKGAADGSLPVTTGELFEEQLEIWYTIGNNDYYKGKDGFNAVLDIIRDGGVKAISDKIVPWFYTDETTQTRELIFDEFWYFYAIGDGEEAVTIDQPEWQDTFESKLPSWTDTFNDRLDMAWQEVKDSLVDHYGYTENDERFTK